MNPRYEGEAAPRNKLRDDRAALGVAGGIPHSGDAVACLAAIYGFLGMAAVIEDRNGAQGR
jgi:hypothetical protein